jgi:hypothetical protein
VIPSVQPFAVSAFVLDFKVRNIERANCFNRACKCIVHGFAPFGSATFSPHRSQGAKNLRSIKPLSFAVIAIAHCALKQILRERPAGRLAVQYSTASQAVDAYTAGNFLPGERRKGAPTRDDATRNWEFSIREPAGGRMLPCHGDIKAPCS